MNKLLMATVLAWALGSAPQAIAGPWARDKGNAFLSSSAIATWPSGRPLELPDIYGSTYFEYGLGRRITFGLDVGSSDATRMDRLKAVGFLRYTLTAPSTKHQVALDLGAGKHQGSTVIRFGASYGFGFKSFSHNSWLTLDAYGLRSAALDATVLALDATYGISFERGKFMTQLSGYKGFEGAKTTTLTPSYAHSLSKGRHLEVGVTLGISGKPDPSLKIGIWQEF